MHTAVGGRFGRRRSAAARSRSCLTLAGDQLPLGLCGYGKRTRIVAPPLVRPLVLLSSPCSLTARSVIASNRKCKFGSLAGGMACCRVCKYKHSSTSRHTVGSHYRGTITVNVRSGGAQFLYRLCPCWHVLPGTAKQYLSQLSRYRCISEMPLHPFDGSPSSLRRRLDCEWKG